MKTIRRIALCLLALSVVPLTVRAQRIPEAIEYSEVYDFIEELTTDGIIRSNAAIKPYTRDHIARLLTEAQSKDSLLSPRQRDEVQFYLQDYALECDTLPTYYSYGHRHVTQWITPVSNLSLADPSLHILTKDKIFKFRLRPILGMDLSYNKKGLLMHRWYGAEIQMDIARHLSIWGSIRDNSWSGLGINNSKIHYGWRLADNSDPSNPVYAPNPALNNIPGVQYKESNYGGDFSDSRGGISLYTWWGSIGVQRERIQWGDAQHCSNILSAHNPAVPMVTLQLTPCKWFQFDYFHAWLPSNVTDSSYYYTERYKEGETKLNYRPANKFMAANMFTFMPIKYIQFSFGNSIVYAERNVQAAYFIPIAFFKSLDHLLTKGLGSENQNSQVFASISVRPTDHLRLYGSFYLDEFKLARLKKSNPEHNPVSYLVGFNWSGWPVRGLSLRGEFMRSYIATYTHSIKVLDFTSNSFNMGHYMGDNAQSIFVQLAYRPVRGLRLTLDYTCDTKYRNYDYVRYYIAGSVKPNKQNPIIAQKPFSEKTWRNDVVNFRAVYEVFNNCYAHVDFTYNNARAYAPASERTDGEDRGWNADGTSMNLTGAALESYYLNKFTPVFYQGGNFTFSCGLSFGF
ncbi:MAG: hypothetical protein IJR09_02400 [Paludibacteraceae bacterium]|nr:hypothetical protein [Paludibacteraceae bacterium]MBR0065281.1 hypothetical protein [Paludibacteraceae bacterium]